MYPKLFKKEAGFVVPEINPEAAWAFMRPSIAVRKYNGETVLLKRKFLFWKKWYARHWLIPGKWVPAKELALYGNLSRALAYPPVEHDFLGFGEYKPGYYTLTDELLIPRLVSDKNAEQAGNINTMEIHLNPDIEDVFYSLARSLANSGYRGVLFKSRQNQDTAELLREDFDWHGIAQSDRSRDYGLSKVPPWANNGEEE